MGALRGGERRGERRGGGVGRLIEGGGVRKPDGKNLQILDLHRLASLNCVQKRSHRPKSQDDLFGATLQRHVWRYCIIPSCSNIPSAHA